MKEKELVLFMESVHISPVADPGGGARKAPPPFILRLKTEGPKKNFSLETSPTPLISGSGMTAPLPPPPPPPYLKVWIRREPSFAHTRKVYVSEFQVKN